MTSLVKDVENIKNKVFYIDRRVNPYLNQQINNLVKAIYDLEVRVKELENSNVSNKEETDFLNNNDELPNNETKTTKKTQSRKTTNEIRTINIE